MLPKDYKGPTSGRITVGPEGVTNQERFYDKPLTREEQDAAVEFLALSPSEQVREYRRLKWNLDVLRKNEIQSDEIIYRQNRELLELRTKLAAYTPDGYTMPLAAAALLAHAEDHGWRTARAWHVPDPSEDDQVDARLEIGLTNGWKTFRVSWSVDQAGHGRMIRSGLARELQGSWRDAPSLIKIKNIITESSDKE